MSDFVQNVTSEVPMYELDEDNGSAARAATMLNKIATALGCPVSAFSEPRTCEPAETDELLRFWQMIEHTQDRAKVLAFVRHAATANGS